MSDYEKLDSFASVFNGVQLLFTSYVSILFAFLVASWLIAHKLNTVLAVLCLGLFTLVSLYFVSLTYFVSQNLIALIELIQAEVATGQSTLGWVGFTRTDEPPPLIGVLILTEILAYAGTLVFFFYQRKTGKVNRVS